MSSELDQFEQFLHDLLEQHEDEIVESGTDWVVETALDLRGARPRQESRRLVASVVEFNRELLTEVATGRDKRDAFIEFVTSYRASLEFNISTLMRGFLSFRKGLQRVLEEHEIDSEHRLAILERADEIYFDSIFAMADTYVTKMRKVIEERQRQIRVRDLQVARLERRLAESLLKRFLAPSVVDDIISGRRSIDQEPRSTYCTVMFADLVGFTHLTQTLDTKRLTELLNQYLATMSEVVFFHRGTIDKFIGDTIMALFGTPVEMERKEQALQAARCAVDMQRALVELDENPVTRGLPPLSMRIGIDAGNVLVGTMGSSYRSDFTAIGMYVNRASRLQTVCPPGEVYLSSDVAQYLPSSMLEPVGSLQLDGIIGSVLSYRVVSGTWM
ncbi:adenylate/guanylate cyclase domain-containing protein [Haliangium sp.]|uniref:adenylate/guanylate cyclase domain-containing protein n=1 Tax=Haliangium sp. TaxID=2663208 RepID=UPI003D0E7A73